MIRSTVNAITYSCTVYDATSVSAYLVFVTIWQFLALTNFDKYHTRVICAYMTEKYHIRIIGMNRTMAARKSEDKTQCKFMRRLCSVWSPVVSSWRGSFPGCAPAAVPDRWSRGVPSECRCGDAALPDASWAAHTVDTHRHNRQLYSIDVKTFFCVFFQFLTRLYVF